MSYEKQCASIDKLMEKVPYEGCAYRHYKGTLYLVTGFSMHTETKEVLVHYRKLMAPNVNWTWARPWKNWITPTEDGYTRFKREHQYDTEDRI